MEHFVVEQNYVVWRELCRGNVNLCRGIVFSVVEFEIMSCCCASSLTEFSFVVERWFYACAMKCNNLITIFACLWEVPTVCQYFFLSWRASGPVIPSTLSCQNGSVVEFRFCSVIRVLSWSGQLLDRFSRGRPSGYVVACLSHCRREFRSPS